MVWQSCVHSIPKYFSAQLCFQTFVHMNNLHMSKASVQSWAHLFSAIFVIDYLLVSHMRIATHCGNCIVSEMLYKQDLTSPQTKSQIFVVIKTVTLLLLFNHGSWRASQWKGMVVTERGNWGTEQWSDSSEVLQQVSDRLLYPFSHLGLSWLVRMLCSW